MSNRRELVRVDTRIRPTRAVEITPFGNPLPLDLLVVNISGGGMMCQVTRPLSRDAKIEVTFRLEGGHLLRLTARTVRIMPGPNRGRPTFLVGCQFVDLTLGQQDELIGFVFAQQAASLRRQWQEEEVS